MLGTDGNVNVYSQVKTTYTDDTDFDPEKVKKGSVAAAGLCKWVHAMVVYNRVAKVVGPKRAALAEAESTLAQAMAQLGEKQAMLKVILCVSPVSKRSKRQISRKAVCPSCLLRQHFLYDRSVTMR